MSEQPQYPRCSEQNGCDSEGDFFPPPSPFVVLPSASGSAAAALAFVLSRKACLEFGWFASQCCAPESSPLSRRQEAREPRPQLEGGGLRRYLQLVCGLKPKSLPLGRGAEQPAEQPASLPACSLTSPGWLDSVGCESWEGRSEGWWQSHATTRCDFDSTSPKKEKKEKKQAQEISVRKRAKETMVVVCRFFLNNYCLSL